jgi:hypothetical protein
VTVANPGELRRARLREADAIESRRQIERLPRRIGQRIRWANGVVWTRVGDDAWLPVDGTCQVYGSDHVASLDWEPLPSLAQIIEQEKRS